MSATEKGTRVYLVKKSYRRMRSRERHEQDYAIYEKPEHSMLNLLEYDDACSNA